MKVARLRTRMRGKSGQAVIITVRVIWREGAHSKTVLVAFAGGEQAHEAGAW